ncbi:MAG TPA: CpsD/CapB family tyrosine-protein kinase [Symbiobacteriaceae bacterium]|nr:CpsD/CapB family tyrosine-protein kinase [Symbiobacteriaceae bacterium]
MRATLGVLSKMIVTHHDPGAIASEAYRVLRTNLQFLGLDEPLRTMLVTSATPGEGKSTTVANLAVAFAQTGARVCLVDADLRRPTVAKLFGLDNWSGLTTALIGQAPLTECLRPTDVPGLSVMTSGPIPPNPAELLGSARMSTLLGQLTDSFDMVLVDSPPVLAVTDAAVLAPKVGGVLMVVRSGNVDHRQVTRAKEAIEAVKAKVLGVVLSAVQPEGRDGYYYYYYHSEEPSAGRSKR